MKTVNISREGVVERDLTHEEALDLSWSQTRVGNEVDARETLLVATRARRVAAFSNPPRDAGLDALRAKVTSMCAVLRELLDAEP